MERCVRGILDFQDSLDANQRAEFKRLAGGQAPVLMLVTCSDSRIDPSLLMRSSPGDIFVIRNAGNIVPPIDGHPSGEAATIEYGIQALNVRDIVVCGHSHCGAMTGLIKPEIVEDLPQVKSWLVNAQAACERAKVQAPGVHEEVLLQRCVECNVLLQIEHLKTYPAVKERLAEGNLQIHGMVFHINSAAVDFYDEARGEFVPLRDVAHRFVSSLEDVSTTA